ncbi:hypothetical protein JAAARDRAFT_56908 [Jaapia argillacea MUCL 33604]|uniref:Protein kinase domain-containing protein n=1 Tax=Jaapia argillacea MUCL 33604 TaxID=933084 RepID=A0A067PVL5_9AGAM|nr:hypothetical protein JAAARDRAFT_56908 [Jaapia argillacea MUCL 33604]
MGVLRSESRTEQVAMKQLRMFMNMSDSHRNKGKNLFRREAQIWSRFKHRFILEFLGFAMLDGNRFFLISPWVGKGNAMQYLEENPEHDRTRLTSQIADALNYLHSGGSGTSYVHGDLKGDNVLISDEGNALLCDFGLTRHVEKVASMTATPSGLSTLGHIRFSAPELFTSGRPTTHSDVFAFGCLVIQIFTGHLPYDHLEMDIQVLYAVAAGELPHRPSSPAVVRAGLDDRLWALVMRCFIREPSMRIKMSEIFEVLSIGEA